MKWNAVYKRIILMDDPKKGSASVLNQWENQGKKLTKWELSRVIKELRKFKRFNLALEVRNIILCFCLLLDIDVFFVHIDL